jgi:DNA-binding IclR family transcriptional regulator
METQTGSACIVALLVSAARAAAFTIRSMSSHHAPGVHETPPSAGWSDGVEGGPQNVQSLDRALRLLKAVAASPDPATPLDLARACDINRSTAWRLLGTLERHGLVERHPVTGRYGVGYAAFQIASTDDTDSLARRLRPILQRTADATREIATLAVAKRFGLVYVDQADPPGPESPSWNGRQIPLHATSAGKVFLAWLPAAERDAVLPAALERFTATTITDRDRLERELERVRSSGFATCSGEYEDFSNGASAAVFDHHHRPIVIVNLWGPSLRVTRRRLPSLGRAALRAAHEMALVLEYAPA